VTATPVSATSDRSRSGECVCVYGIVDDRFRLPPSSDGVPLRLHHVGGLAAVYSQVDTAEFAGVTPELAESSRLATIARRHDGVVRSLAEDDAVLPVRLGTLFPDVSSLTSLLADTEVELRAQLDRLRGRREWSLRIRPVPAAAASAPDEPAGSGTDYLLRRRDDRRQAAEMRDDLLAAMSAADDALAARAESVAGPGLAAPTMSMSRGYLVRDEMAAEFTAVASEVAVELERRGCDTTLAGPLPAYSFVDVRLEVRSRG
jgi:hypothetical protein